MVAFLGLGLLGLTAGSGKAWLSHGTTCPLLSNYLISRQPMACVCPLSPNIEGWRVVLDHCIMDRNTRPPAGRSGWDQSQTPGLSAPSHPQGCHHKAHRNICRALQLVPGLTPARRAPQDSRSP